MIIYFGIMYNYVSFLFLFLHECFASSLSYYVVRKIELNQSKGNVIIHFSLNS